jgi:hypothetical protein
MPFALAGGMKKPVQSHRFQCPEDFVRYCDLSLECDIDLELIGAVLSENGQPGLYPAIGCFILRALDRRNCLEHMAFDRKLDLRTIGPEEAHLHLKYFEERLGEQPGEARGEGAAMNPGGSDFSTE